MIFKQIVLLSMPFPIKLQLLDPHKSYLDYNIPIKYLYLILQVT